MVSEPQSAKPITADIQAETSENKEQSTSLLPKPTHLPTTLQRARTNPASLSPKEVLYLQRTIGNQAVTKLLKNKFQQALPSTKPNQEIEFAKLASEQPPNPTPSDKNSVQRYVGFEYELNVPVVKPGSSVETAPEYMEDTYEFATSQGLEEKTVIDDRDYDDPGKEKKGFKVVVDHGPISDAVDDFKKLYKEDYFIGKSIKDSEFETGRLEYVTTALDEMAPSYRADYKKQLNAVKESIEKLQQRDLANNAVRPNGFLVGIPEDLRSPIKQNEEPVYSTEEWNMIVNKLRSQINYLLYMQATSGIDLAAIPRLINPEIEKEFVEDSKTNNHRELLQDVYEVTNPIMENLISSGTRPNGFTKEHGEEVEGYITLLVQYIIGNITWQTRFQYGGTTKNMVPFWSKVDLADVRKNLSPKAREFISKNVMLISKLLSNVDVSFTEKARKFMVYDEGYEPPFEQGVGQFLVGALSGDSDTISERPGLPMNALSNNHQAVPLEFRALATATLSSDGLVDASLAVVEKVRSTNFPNSKPSKDEEEGEKEKTQESKKKKRNSENHPPNKRAEKEPNQNWRKNILTQIDYFKTIEELRSTQKLEKVVENIGMFYQGYEPAPHQKEALELLGLKLTGTIPDGDCAYNAVIESSDINSNVWQLRQDVTEWALAIGLINEEQTQKMNDPGNFEGDLSSIAIKTLANIFKLKIKIIPYQAEKPIKQIDPEVESEGEIYLVHIEGIHPHFYGTK
jgi:hypothetical protein